MKTGLKIAAILFLSAIIALPYSSLGQGSLTPPGPPGPTMLTLSQVQPRTPISSTPFSITAPGSYYLTTNLSGVLDTYGIAIFANDVTIDLNGFELNGNGVGYGAIYSQGNVTNIYVYNGSIRNWSLAQVELGSAQNSRVEKLRISDGLEGLEVGSNCVIVDCTCLNAGNSSNPALRAAEGCLVKDCVVGGQSVVGVLTGNNCVVENCFCRSNVYGIMTGTNCTVRNCTAIACSHAGISIGDGAKLTGCHAEWTAGTAISVGNSALVENCLVRSNAGTGFNGGTLVTYRNCTAINNTGTGFYGLTTCNVEGCVAVNNIYGIWMEDNSTVKGCTALSNSVSGIAVTGYCRVIDSMANYNSQYGISTAQGAQVINCQASLNSLSGIIVYSSSTVSGCVCSYNIDSGIYVYLPGCKIVNNTCDNNNISSGGLSSQAGIYIDDNFNLVDGNHVYNNGGSGIAVANGYTKNVIIHNNAGGNGVNYSIVSGNDVGPIGNAATATSPFANISN